MFSSDDLNEINYINFEQNFSINENNLSTIIFAPNGIGKSTLCKLIINKNPSYKFIDYDNIRKDFVSNKKKIEISANINLIEIKKNEIKKKLDALSLSKIIKRYVPKKSDASLISDEFASIYGDDKELLMAFSMNNFDHISQFQDDAGFVFKNFHQILELTNLTQQIEYLRNENIKKALKIIHIHLDENETVCPACNSNFDVPIKNIIIHYEETIEELTDNLVREYSNLKKELSSNDAVLRLDEIINIITSKNIQLYEVMSFLFSENHNQNDYEHINNIKDEINSLTSELETLEEERNRFYENMQSMRDKIYQLFMNKFNIQRRNITFDHNLKMLTIKLDRNIETYSTSEINLMVLIVKLYEFVASDSPIIIIDDPLSSYDITNQYVIMYEIISKLNNFSRKALIFTHNIETINIANSQHNSTFNYKYIENVNSYRYINPLPCNNDNIFNISTIMDCSTHEQFSEYLKLLIDRDTNVYNGEAHKIFHYDSPFSLRLESGTEVSNDYLSNLIDEYTPTKFTNSSFYNNSVLKIIYLSAMRVWIEKKIYELFPNDSNLVGKMFGEKINYIFPINRESLWTGSQNVTRSFLMSKKVMLNLNEHATGQTSPFYFALNMTLNDLAIEIDSIKGAFV